MRFLSIIAAFFFLTGSAYAYENKSGFESGANYYTGSTRSGSKTCNECHTKSVTSGNVFELNVPALTWSSTENGFLYAPGQTYNMVVSLTTDDDSGGMNLDQNGFVIEILDSVGQPAGTFIPDSTTELSNDGTIVLDADGASTQMTQWTFQWTAPIAGIGTLLVHGAAVDGDGDGGDGAGDSSDYGFTRFVESSVTNTQDSAGCGTVKVISPLGHKNAAGAIIFLFITFSLILAYRRVLLG